MAPDCGNGQPRIPAEERLNVFALVTYIPGPLGRFLDKLHRELVPGCSPHAHVSLLPPRPLSVDWHEAREQARELLEAVEPFDIELKDVAIFPITEVVYLEVGAGSPELRHLHDAMNSRALAFQEPFAYHPHVTIAQELPRGAVAMARELAERRWQEFGGQRRFRAEHAVLVQNTLSNFWIDLATFSLGAVPAKL